VGTIIAVLDMRVVFPVNEIITGRIGMVVIGAAFTGSIMHNKRAKSAGQDASLQAADARS
jgi:hypothetical protein